MTMKAALYILLLTLAGCSTPAPKVTVLPPVGDGILKTEPFPAGTIVIATDARLQEEYKKLGGDHRALGFWDSKRNQLWVLPAVRPPYVDKNGVILPNMQTLGHELLHHSRGYWHE